MKNLISAIARFLLGLKRPSKTTNTRRLRDRGETRSSFIIREATSADIPALAALHVKTWSETYWNVRHPPNYELREYQWREQFQKTDGKWFCFVVEDRNGALVGFAKGAAYASSDLPGYSGELNKIYLLRDYQRLGLGRRLVGHVPPFLKPGHVLDGTVRRGAKSLLRVPRSFGRRKALEQGRRVSRRLRLAGLAKTRIHLPH